MPSGIIPAYTYRPTRKSVDPHLRTCSSLRARLFAGGTYFRAREPGQLGNNLSVEVIAYDAVDAVCVITNYTVKPDEMVTGPASVQFFDAQVNTNEAVELYNLHLTPAQARKYSISFKIAPALPTYEDLGAISSLSLVSLPGILVAKVTPAAPFFAPADVVSITPRKRVYRLMPKTYAPTDTGGGPPPDPIIGWDIDDLRAQVNVSDPWVEMLPRSSVASPGGGPLIPNPDPADYQDRGADSEVLTPFEEARLVGGDGIPANPDQEHTGPFRSLVHVNYGEAYNGRLTEVNIVYEWNGKDAKEGAWLRY